jgi:hypothetical protein
VSIFELGNISYIFMSYLLIHLVFFFFFFFLILFIYLFFLLLAGIVNISFGGQFLCLTFFLLSVILSCPLGRDQLVLVVGTSKLVSDSPLHVLVWDINSVLS